MQTVCILKSSILTTLTTYVLVACSQLPQGRMKKRMKQAVIFCCLVLPALAAAEITLEEPISDLTLVLNEPVSVQLPHGITDRTKAGTWKHQIKNINVRGKRRKPLPAGLTYDPATRRLSGTPAEEYDMTHHYLIEYRWGRKAAKREKLVVPFRLVVRPPVVRHPIEAHIRTFIGEARSVSQFVTGLPALHKSQSIYMVASQALDQDFVSETHPRMLSFGADARTIFAWGSNPDSPLYDQVEFITAGEQEWTLGVIDFAADPPTVERNSEACQTCHNGHPLWAEYPSWPGALFNEARRRDETLLQGYRGSADPRLSAVGASPRLRTESGMLTELTSQLAIRHGELLANQLIAHPDFSALAQQYLCGRTSPRAAVHAHWPLRVIDLSRMGAGDGGLALIDPDASPFDSRPGLYQSLNANLEEVILLLIVNHLYEIDPEIQALYARTSNTESAQVAPYYASRYLHFAPGTATAADELHSRMDVVELVGQANIDKRAALPVSPSDDMILSTGHLDAMIPKVCQVLSGE